MSGMRNFLREQARQLTNRDIVTNTRALVTDRSAVLSAPTSRRRNNRNQPNLNGRGDYYSSFNGIFLGNDGTETEMRLIDAGEFNELYSNGNISELHQRVITINNTQIQADLQAVADRSSTPNANGEYQEHQIYLTLDMRTATISSVFGEPGVRDRTYMEYHPAPTIGVNFVDRPGGLVLIGQVHGHPPAPQGEVTLRTMSTYDVESSFSANIPVYGIDAMDGPTRGRPANIHRVTPDGTITRRVGRTSSGFDIGRDAMLIWGRRDLTKQ